MKTLAVVFTLCLLFNPGLQRDLIAQKETKPKQAQVEKNDVSNQMVKHEPGFLHIADEMMMSISAGEVQSTVIAPGMKTECPNGRLLISDDTNKNMYGGPVQWRDLDVLNPMFQNTQKSYFDPLPSTAYMISGNDHDIVTFNNGDVLYVRAIRINAPLSPEPDWFDVTYRIKYDTNPVSGGYDPTIIYGPGARSGLAIWRSTDGGENFEYIYTFDPASVEDGSAAMPQWLKPKYAKEATEFPGNPSHPIWDMGGSDGPLTKVNLANNKVYVTFQCLGYLQDESINSHFALSKTPLNKTLVLESDDFGGSWKSLGFIPVPRVNWRFGIVPLENNILAFARGDCLWFGKEQANGKYWNNIAPITIPTEKGTFITYWDQVWGFLPFPTPTSDYGYDPANVDRTWNKNKYIYSNILANTIIFRTPPGKNIAIAFPASTQGSGGFYKLYFFDRQNNKWAEGPPIKPTTTSPNCLIMHLTAIDLGKGPVLLYWYDVNIKTLKVKMRGRLITADGECSYDFSISRNGGLEQMFDLTENDYWYGDYHTAGGYIEQGGTITNMKPTYHYYPVWVEPDGKVHYTEVSCKLPLPASIYDLSIKNLENSSVMKVKPGQWVRASRKIDNSRIPVTLEDYEDD